MKNLTKIIAFAASWLCSLLVYAGEIQPPLSGILRSTSIATIHVGDSVHIFQSAPVGGIADYAVRNIISLNFDNSTTHFFSAPTSISVDVSILRKNAAGGTMTPETATLIVNTDSRYNQQTIDKAVKKLVDGYSITIVIDAISVNGVSKTDLPDYVYVEEEIHMNRYTQYTGIAPTISAIDTLNTDCDTVGTIGTIDELKVNWGMVAGAEEYQLEWTFVNNYGVGDSTTSIGQSSLFADFKHNSTRITTTFQTYRITQAYERGYIAFRVRAVGRDYLHPDKYIYGNWSAPDYVALNNSSVAKYYNWREHERVKNWQYSATFAEEGKKKEVISYFDGSLHNRQSVTKVNSDKNVIVGETIYDYQGRPAVNVLPTPVPAVDCNLPFTEEPALKYYYNYNRNMSGVPYSKKDFDKDSTGICTTVTSPMDSISGSSQYYSGADSNKVGFQAYVPNAERFPFSQVEYTNDNTGRVRSQSGVGKTFQLGNGHETKYIYSHPNQIQLDRLFGSEVGDAAHYKKNTVIDANGQISISYLNQEGKTIATSLAGNPPTEDSTIFMEALPSEANAAVPFTVDAFNKDAHGNSLLNTITPLQDSVVFSTQLSVSYNSTYSFNYNLSIDTLYDSCLASNNFCISCIYDLRIKITDECGTLVTPKDTTTHNPIYKRIGHLTPAPNGFTMHCINPRDTTDAESLTVNLTPGVYTVSKTLSINKEARDFYVQNYLDSTTCIKTKADFVQDALAHIDTTDCYPTCATCAAALGTKDDFVASGKGTDIQYDFLLEQCIEPCRDKTLCETSFDMMLVDVSLGGQYGKFNAITEDASGERISVFNQGNSLPCNFMSYGTGNWHHPRLVINGTIYNVYLNGNGERVKANVNQTSPTSSWNPEVINSSLVYLDSATGDHYTYPENLKFLKDFIPYWNDYFARSLVMYHPEYAYYIACKDQSKVMAGDSLSTDQLDSLMLASNTFAEAVTNRIIKSNYSSITAPTQRIVNLLSDTSTVYDPFFANAGAFDSFYGPFTSSYSTFPYTFNNSQYESQMAAKMTSYYTSGANVYSMIEMAAIGARCGNNYGSTPSIDCKNFGKDFIPNPLNDAQIAQMNDSIRNKEWQNFKNFYIAEKRKFEFNRMNFFAMHINNFTNSAVPPSNLLGGCNKCIGNTGFNPYTSGFYQNPYYGFPFYSIPAFNSAQPCAFGNYYKFQHASKRFIDPANSGLNTSNAEYQLFQLTGQCPMAFELMGFLNTMAQSHYLYPSSQTYLGSLSAFGPNLYNAITPSGSPYKNYKWEIASVSSGVLTANIIDTTVSPNSVVCALHLDISGKPIANYTKIIGLQNLRYANTSSGVDHFKVWATYFTDSTNTTTATDTISGSSCFTIHGCQFEPSCSANQLAQDFMNLTNLMKVKGQTNILTNMSADSTIAPALSTTLKNTLGSPTDSLIWNPSSPDVEIYDQANSSTKLVFTIISFNPSSAAGSVVAFDNIRSNYNNLFKMDGLDVNGNKIADIEGKAVKMIGTVITPVSMGECGLPANPDCSTVEHQVRNDLEGLLSEFLTKKPFDGNVNLYAQANFTTLLKSYFNDTLISTTGTYIYNTGDTTSYDSLKINTNNSCNFQLYHNQFYHNPLHPNSHAVNFGDLVAVNNLTGVPPLDAEASFHDFYFIGTFYKDSVTYKDTVRGTSCFPIKNCDLCTEGVFATGRECGNISLGEYSLSYNNFRDSIITYNNSGFALLHNHIILTPSYGQFFLDQQKSSCYTYFMNELTKYNYAPADTNLPLPIDSCSVLVSRCDSLYSAYVDAVYDYNSKMKGVATLISTVKGIYCFNEHYCECANKFISGLTAIVNGYPLTSDSQLSLEAACTPVDFLCSHPDTAFTFPPVPYSPNLCVLQMIAAATQNALNHYHQYVDSVTTSIITRYNEHCLHPLENFHYTYLDKEYHFTLYYYDQAGNLVKTIPPEGVEFLNIAADTDPLELQVMQDRANNSQSVYTSHRMATTYLYNSLNQLVRQDMPDHDKMNICESKAPNGLDADLTINSVQFVDASKGYLTGFVNRTIAGTQLQRGYVYTTNDAGQNWSRIKGMAAGDMQKVQMVDSTTGYAVSNYGMIFKTLDGGHSWDAKTTLYNATPHYFGNLYDLYFTSDSSGIVGGIKGSGNGGVYRTTDGGLTFTPASGFALHDTITGLTYDGTNYFASVKNSNGKIYSSSDGINWTEQTSFTANNLKKVQYINNDTAFAVGYDGTLLRSNNTNTTWTLIATNSPYKFSDVYFKNGSQGIAIIDSLPGKGKIYKTLNGGKTWTVLSLPGKYYSSLQLYDLTQSRVIAGGENGLISKVLMHTAPFGTAPVSVSSVTDDFNYTDAILNTTTNKLITLAVSNLPNIYFNYDSQSAAWTSINSGIGTGFSKGLLSVSGTNSAPVVQGLLCGTNGILTSFIRPYNSTTVFSTVTIAGGGSPYFKDITCKNKNSIGTFYAFDTVSKTIYRVVFNTDSTSAATATQLTGAIAQNINSIALSRTSNRLLAVGNNGTIQQTTSVSGSTVTWNNYSSKVLPLPLNDIEHTTSNKVTAVGNDGTEWYSSNSGVDWQLAVNGTSVKFNAIKINNSGKGLIAANNGKLFAVSGGMSISPTLTSISTSVTDNFTDVALQTGGNKAYATTQAGKAVYIGNYTASSPTATTTLASNVNGALNGVCFLPSGSSTMIAIATGDKAGVIELVGASGIIMNEVFTTPLKSIHFYDNNNGYVVDSGYVLRHTTNGGVTWNVVVPSTSLPVIAKVVSTAANKALIVGSNKYVAQINNELLSNSITVPSIITSDFKDIKFNGNGFGVIVGSNGWAAKITASGSSYVVTSIGQAGSGFDFNTVHVFNNMNNSGHDKHFMAAGTNGKIYYYNSGASPNFVIQNNASSPSNATYNSIYFHDDRVGYVVGNAGVALKCTLLKNIGEAGSEVTNSSIAWNSLCHDAIYLTHSSDTVNIRFNAIAFSTRINGFMAGSYSSSGNHRHALLLNDESDLYSTRFYYDRLGRMVVSQNTKQFNKSTFSYTLYDQLGRIKEVGEKYENTTSTRKMNSIFGTDINGIINLKAIDDANLMAWIADATGARKEVTHTYYDNQIILPTSLGIQENLRKRVASVTYEDQYDGVDTTYQFGSHYTYDPYGNVKTLWQENKKLYDNAVATSSSLTDQRYKRIDYDYDLISGKVNKVSYQPNERDQFMHRYTYDADNRITKVETSTDDVIWDLEGKYFYYAHGPLARIEYGNTDNKVQGIDYAYTLQGWIKGINSTTLDASRDMGKDADSTSTNFNKYIAKDAFAYSLNYFKGDYKAIDYLMWNDEKKRFEAVTAGSQMMQQTHDLYNGNIKSMVSTIEKIDTTTRGFAKAPIIKPLGNAYKYDQLNRLKSSVGFDSLDIPNNLWAANGQPVSNLYANSFTYDANGNILSQHRSDQAGTEFDAMQYRYKRDATGKLIQNRLYHVNDNTAYTSLQTDDIDDEGTFDSIQTTSQTINDLNNYGYDEIGNLKRDKTEEIDSIKWTVYGKIKSIIRPTTSAKDNLVFDYDPSGNRIAKHVYDATNNWKYTTYYVRDAQGNVMSVYDHKVIPSDTLGGIPSISYNLIEQDIFGSSRIGLYLPNKEMVGALTSSIITHVLGKKQLELSDHLGNVSTIITDRKIPVVSSSDSTVVSYFLADISSTSGFYPFGTIIKSRVLENFKNYRYSFNSKEKLDEINGGGNSYDFGARIYDPRLGRWLSLDPLQVKYPDLSPYNFVANNPIIAVDPDGKVIIIKGSNGESITYTPGAGYSGKDPYISDAVASLDQAFSYGGDAEINAVVNSETVINVVNQPLGKSPQFVPKGESASKGQPEQTENVVLWNPASGAELLVGKDRKASGKTFSPGRLLFHEIDHAHHFIKNRLVFNILRDLKTIQRKFGNFEERRTLKTEDKVYGDKNGEGGDRNSHRGRFHLFNKGPINNAPAPESKSNSQGSYTPPDAADHKDALKEYPSNPK